MSTTTTETPEAPATPAEPEPRGFLIHGVQYPYPETFKLPDTILVRELCAVPWADFEARANGDESNVDDATLFVGMVAIAIARANPTWPRVAVLSFWNELSEDEVELYGFQEPAAGESEAPATELEPSATTGTSLESDASGSDASPDTPSAP